METEVNKRKISDYFELPPWNQTQRVQAYKLEDTLWKNTIPLASQTYHFGIEVEVEGVPEPRVDATHRSYWDITNDNSLRNNGIEFVSVPLRGDQVENAVRQLQQSLPKSHEFSPRTSVHVHMNVRDLEISQIMNLILIYTVMEELLFDYAGASRTNNVFCVRITDTEYVKNYRNFQIDPRQVVHYWNKYTALNLHPMETKGTVEFRHMEGTIDPEKLVNWVNLLACMKTYAKNTPTNVILQEIHTLNSSSTYEIFVNEVFGRWAELLKGDLQTKMENPISYVKLANIPKLLQEAPRAPMFRMEWPDIFEMPQTDGVVGRAQDPQVEVVAQEQTPRGILDELLGDGSAQEAQTALNAQVTDAARRIRAAQRGRATTAIPNHVFNTNPRGNF